MKLVRTLFILLAVVALVSFVSSTDDTEADDTGTEEQPCIFDGEGGS